MAGRTPRTAFGNYFGPLRDAIQCVTFVPLTLAEDFGSRGPTLGHVYAVALNNMDPTPLTSDPLIALTVGQNFRIIRAEGDRGPYRVTTVSYFYSLETADHREIINFQWTPESPRGMTFPHLHIGSAVTRHASLIRPRDLHKAHIPTGRVSLESVIRLAIDEFGVEPKKPAWSDILSTSEAAFMRWKTR